MPLSLPNLLTLARIAAILPAIVLFYLPVAWADWALLALFVAAAVTDWLDGYLARKLKEESAFGRFLDPIADKLLVVALLFMMAATARLPEWATVPAVVILLREVLISGLREFLAGIGVSLPVTRLAKWKTAVQMGAITLLIVADRATDALPLDLWGTAALWLAGALTVASGWDYLRTGIRHMTAAGKK